MAMDLFPFYLYVSFIHHIQDFHLAMSYTVGVLLCFVYPQTVSYVPNVAHVFGFTIHDYSLTIIRR